jgi:hypothetical protein
MRRAGWTEVTGRFSEESSPEDRLDALERRVRRLEEALLGAGALPAPEEPPIGGESVLPLPAHASPSVAAVVSPESPALLPEPREGYGAVALDVLAQIGWSVLVLAGAFLVRALTSSNGAHVALPGVALGLLYSLAVIVVADRAAVRGNRLTADFLGSTGTFVVNAIVAETTTRFGIFTPVAGLAVLAGATALILGMCRKRDVPAVAWTATLGASGTAAYLAFARHVPGPAGLVLLALATATFWMATEHWSWRALSWTPTVFAAALSLWATSSAIAGPEADRLVAFALALGLPVFWCGSVLVGALMRRRRIGALAVVQALLALPIGLGGAIQLVRGEPAAPVLAAAALAAGATAYAFAFGRERGDEARAGRLYFAWVGLAHVLIGSGTLLPAPVPSLVWAALALAAAAVAWRFEPAILQPQAAVYALAAAIGSGLFATSFLALAAPDAAVRPDTAAALAVLAVLLAATALLFVEEPAAGSLPAFAGALLSALGLGAVFVLLLRRPAATVMAASLPALRTIVVSVSAYLLARLWRTTRRNELRTLAYVVLVAGGLKLAAEDLPTGRPMTLFVSFVFYGAALLLIPRLMRSAKTRPPLETR